MYNGHNKMYTVTTQKMKEDLQSIKNEIITGIEATFTRSQAA
jgi:hypothetical protein